MTTIDLLLADDHALVRTSLRQAFETTADLRVTAEAATADEVMQQMEAQRFSLVLLDLNMPGPGGVALLQRLRQRHLRQPVLVLSMHSEGQVVERALRAGANGYVTKDSELSVLIDAVRVVAGGGRYVDSKAHDSVQRLGGRSARAAHQRLSEREQQVLGLIAQGHRLGEIADLLHVSAKTVSTHKMRLMDKLGVDNNADLLKYVALHGIQL